MENIRILTFLAERRVSYSTADEESSPRGSSDMIEEQLTAPAQDKKGTLPPPCLSLLLIEKFCRVI